MLSPVPHLGNATLDWNAVATSYGDRILASLERLMPDLRRHVVKRRHFTPHDFERDLGAYHGSAFSLAPKLTQSAWFRPHNRDPHIPGLYLVGAGTHPGRRRAGRGQLGQGDRQAHHRGVRRMTNTLAQTSAHLRGDHRAQVEELSPRLAPACRADVRAATVVLYAYCRRCDDAVDELSESSEGAQQASAAVARLRASSTPSIAATRRASRSSRLSRRSSSSTASRGCTRTSCSPA